MKPRLFNVLLPMALLAATAVPADPARAEGAVCLRTASAAAPQKVVKVKAPADKPRKEWRLEAL